MKIALVSPYDFSYPGGVTEHLAALAAGLQQRGHDVQILAAYSGYHDQQISGVNIVTRHVTTYPIGGTVARVGVSPLSYFRIKNILDANAFDVIHLQEPLTPSITWLVLLIARMLPQTVTVGTFHAYHERPNWLYAHGRPVFRQFFKMLDNRIVVSEAARTFAEQMFPGAYTLIPNGVDLKRFGKQRRPPEASPDKRLNILFVGRLDERKGFRWLLESFIALKPHFPRLSMTVVGPYDRKIAAPYQRLAEVNRVTDIDFVGYVSPERLPDFYHRADIFCAPSVGFESFGIVLLEAMAAGLPIIATDIAGYRSVMTNNQEGVFVPPRQSQPLTQALRRLIDDADLRHRLGQRGQLTARHYNWDHIIDQIVDLYRQTIEHKQTVQRVFFRDLKSGRYRRSTKQPYPK